MEWWTLLKISTELGKNKQHFINLRIRCIVPLVLAEDSGKTRIKHISMNKSKEVIQIYNKGMNIIELLSLLERTLLDSQREKDSMRIQKKQ